MNVLIRRLGIAVKSIEIKGDRARIGSGEDCEISLADPYLASIVAEIVRRGGEWYIADTGSSLEGVSRGGIKVSEEIFEPGEPYLIGGFEIVREDLSVRRTLSTRSPEESIPQTMFAARLDPLPGTVIQSLDDVRAAKPKAAPPAAPPPTDTSKSKLTFRRLSTGGAATPRPGGAAAPRSRMRLILLAAAVMFGLLLLVVVIGSDSGKPPVPAQTTVAVQTDTAPKTSTAPPPPARRTGDQAALALELDSAFAGWEADLKRRDDPALRRKVVTASLEIGRVYAALGDPRARDYFDRVVRYGAEGSAEVALAKERLELIRR